MTQTARQTSFPSSIVCEGVREEEEEGCQFYCTFFAFNFLFQLFMIINIHSIINMIFHMYNCHKVVIRVAKSHSTTNTWDRT